jgi:hypothetical protein
MCCLTLSKKERQLLGETVFQLRDVLLRVWAKVLEPTVSERRRTKGNSGSSTTSPDGEHHARFVG